LIYDMVCPHAGGPGNNFSRARCVERYLTVHQLYPDGRGEKHEALNPCLACLEPVYHNWDLLDWAVQLKGE
jgi:hypothetical protein